MNNKKIIEKYSYLMSEKERKNLPVLRFIYAIAGIGFGLVITSLSYSISSLVIDLACAIALYQLPLILLKLRHNQQSQEIVRSIPIWVNLIYSLIGENNIYNSIELSYENAPKCLKPDLKKLISEISKDQENRKAYTDFLARYEVDGFKEIMFKLFEFRKLSKEKLKYEITTLNDELSGIETLRREQRAKSELFLSDMLTTVMIAIPCIYMFLCSMLLSELIF